MSKAPEGAVRVGGRELIEGFSFRAPLAVAVAPTDRWLLGGLAAVFDIPS